MSVMPYETDVVRDHPCTVFCETLNLWSKHF